MKKILNFFGFAVALGAVAILGSCSDNDDNGPELRPFNEITAFSIAAVTDIQEYAISEDDGTVEIKVAADFDLNQLVDVTPTITISSGATISPSASDAQDFSKQVTYTVTAEDGTAKTWKVYPVVSSHVSKGFKAYKRSWFTPYAESAAVENTAAVIGDYFISSRTAAGWNASTGAKVDNLPELLNIDGIVTLLTAEPPAIPADKYPFVFTNDDAGNLIGCNLTNWNPDHFIVYLWTSIDAAPKKIIEFDYPEGSVFGRKLVARGDVNSGNGFVVAYDANSGSKNSDHYYWKVTGGTIATNPEVISTNYLDRQWYQQYIPQGTTNISPAFLIARGAANASPIPALSLYSASVSIEDGALTPPLTEEEDEPNMKTGWGNHILHSEYFEFNGKEYISSMILRVIDGSLVYYITIHDVEENTVVFKEKIDQVAGNGNYTGNMEFVQGDTSGDTKTGKLYVFISGTGAMAYELSNLYSN